MAAKILIIDDENLFREDIATLLRQQDYECRTAETAGRGIAELKDFLPDIVLLDIMLPDQSGVDTIDKIMQNHPECAVVMMTAYGTFETAIEAFRKGAVDYILKPLVIDDLFIKLERILKHKRLLQEIKYLRLNIRKDVSSLSLVGKSEAMQRVVELIQKVAPTNSTVLITGDSGTGKEVVAQALHAQSACKNKPFVAINCSALQENLLESELFGHVKGAFTGAANDKEGYFEMASGGTILLDEISEIPMSLQSKLLRVLEQREFHKVGSTKAIQLDARIITATNKNLTEAVKNSGFREDLYYRIAVFEIQLPQLKERQSDIPLLVDYFIQKFNDEMKKNYINASADALQMLIDYDWPGNIRELRNVLERAMILCDGVQITGKGLPPLLGGTSPQPAKLSNLRDALHEFERTFLLQTLVACSWNKEDAARRLEINPSTLYRKMADLGIEKSE
ncbi:MAG: sigma-54-dependent Fis family transcriptional regulator [Calditrichaeota bacterium]|nr:MAG: sigma-54-dependent Fis family transcriptional regulator [Calditrichota bacterium]